MIRSKVNKLVFQIVVLQNWVRKRAFDHIEQGVMLKGDNVQQAKLVVYKIKVMNVISTF